MLSAYFDESGTERNHSTVLTVGGYIANEKQWKNFCIEWQKMLNDEQLEYFHMTDLECFHNQFRESKGWNKKRQIHVIQRAHDIIKRNTLKDFDISVVWSVYDSLIKSYRGKNPPSAYAVLVNTCLSITGSWAKDNGYSELINYVFESGVKGVGWIKENYKKVHIDEKAIEAFRINRLSFEDKRKVIQLQAADVNAYESWKQMENRIVNGKLRPLRKSALNLKQRDGGIYSYHYDQDNLPQYLELIEIEDI